MYSQYSNQNDIAYGIKTFILDSDNDLTSLPTNLKAGCKAKVISNSKTYILNHSGEWVAQVSGGSGDPFWEDIDEGGSV